MPSAVSNHIGGSCAEDEPNDTADDTLIRGFFRNGEKILRERVCVLRLFLTDMDVHKFLAPTPYIQATSSSSALPPSYS